MQEYFKNKTVLTLLAHPDDETLGCGGTLHRASSEGAKIYCYFPIKRVANDCYKAIKILGIQPVHFGKWNDQVLDTYPLKDLSIWFNEAIERVEPDIIILHHYNCTNQDHRICYQAGIIATRDSDATIITCEVPSSTGYLKPVGFEPNFYIAFPLDSMTAKIEAMNCYKTEVKKAPNPRSSNQLVNLMELRGGECNQQFAEGFMLIRGVQ